MGVTQEWVSFRCACGFELRRVPRTVLEDLPRCPGCGASLRAARGQVEARRMTDIRGRR